MRQEIKRLYRNEEEARLAGVCSGIGHYVGVDPVVVRLLWVLVTCVTGFLPGILAYPLAWILIPSPPVPMPVRAPEGRADEGLA